MNDRSAIGRLCWKEFRQLLPLGLLFPLLAVIFFAVAMVSGNTPLVTLVAGGISFLAATMPGLYATGVGALSVSYEKEQRTLGWLASLPIKPIRIVRVKLLMAFAGLILFWALATALLAIARLVSRQQTSVIFEEIGSFAWPVHTLFLMLAGFALAWSTRSGMAAILWVLPVATIPVILSNLILSLFRWRFDFEIAPAAPVLISCQILSIAVAWWLAERNGSRAIGAQSTGTHAGLRSMREEGLSVPWAWQAEGAVPRSEPSALVWQFIAQNRMVLLGLGLMLATAALIWPLDLWGRGVLSIMITVLGVSWLGTSVFQGDSIAQRIRFLADRGIAPGWVWSTRQLTPASIVSLFLLGLLIALTVSGTAADLFPLLTLLVLIIYGTSQWVAQLLPSPIISSICAPLVAAMAAAYFALSYVWFAPPWWLMAVTILIPLVATRALTRRWMDRRLGWDYLFANVGFAALMILPIAPQVVRSINEPRMPAEVKRELSAIAPPVVLGSTSTRLKELVIAGANGGTAYEVETVQSNDPPRMMADAWADKLAQVQEQLNSTQVPISVSSGAVLETLRGIAELCLIADSNPALTAAERDEGAKTYPVAVRLLSQAARRLRMSHRLIEQDMADLIEIWLINELRRAGARERLGSEIDSNVRELLGDREGRQKARERAVAASWADYQMATKKDRWTNPDQIGGYQLFDIIEPGGAWGARSRGEFAVGELWQWLRAGKQGTNPQRLERIARAWGLPPSTYGLGDTGPIWRADDLNRYVHPGFRSYKPRPGAQWFAAWEDEAEAMGRSFEGGNQESAGVPKE
jgi:hypothetical protein